jgi:hypothetical protein
MQRAAARAVRSYIPTAALGRRTGGDDDGAQQLRVRVAGADRVGVEVRSVGDSGVVAAPRGDGRSHPERRPRGLARGGGGGAASRIGLDPHGARRTIVAVHGTGHVRACGRQHATQQPRTPVTRAVPREYPRVPTLCVLRRRLPPRRRRSSAL